jgi:catechol 2,3-dioxygenase-like lactoylglutathione lyase family enzyme
MDDGRSTQGNPMPQQAKLRHFAITTAEPEETARFYEQAFGMKRVGRTDSPIARGVYLSDGVINLAILKYKDVGASGPERGLDWYGIHHVGFWVDEVQSAGEQISAAGGTYMMGEVSNSPSTFYEVKYRGPDGVIIDITEHGWAGAVKDAEEREPAPAR